MPQKSNSVSSPRKGIEKDKNPIDLSPTEYTFSLNSNISSETGDVFLLQEEPSNLLCVNFPTGFVVIGREYNTNTNRTYFFITNDETKVSEIGYIEGNINITDIDDVISTCNCDVSYDLAESLENQSQSPTCTYTTLLNDSCNLCLGFNKNKPIHKIVIKNEVTGTTIWWADNITLRYINLDELDNYLFTGVDTCGEDNTIPTCLDCEKLRVFRQFEQPIVKPKVIQQGGNMPAGSLEALIAYCDLNGNEISNYYSVTNPVSLFDFQNTTLEQKDLEYQTNFGVKFEVENLDTDYPYYKIALVFSGAISGINYYEEGIHSTSDREVYVTSLKGLKTISIQKLTALKPVYEKADGLTASNGTLLWYGTTEQPEINLQPIANLLGGFLRWQTHETDEDLYRDGVNTSLYKSTMRDENLAYAIQFLFDNGFTTADFPLINRPATEFEKELVDNQDTQSILEYAPKCDGQERNKRYQFYNTAVELGYITTPSENSTIISRPTTRTCIVEDVYTTSSMEVEIDCAVPYIDFESYIETYGSEICNSSSVYYNEDLCAILNNSYSSFNCNLAALFESTCDTPQLIAGSTNIFLGSLGAETVTTSYLDPEDMLPTPPAQFCMAYKPGSNDEGYEDDATFTTAYMPVGSKVYKRNLTTTNTECFYASALTTAALSTYLNYAGDMMLSNLHTAKTALVSGDFTGFVNIRALWYKVDFGADDVKILEITQQSACEADDDIPIGTQIRLTTFNTCSDTVYEDSQIIDVSQGNIIQLNKADYPSGVAYIAIDSPIEEKSTGAYVISPVCGCFSLLLRNRQCTSRTVNLTDLAFYKRQSYQANCDYSVSINNGCEPSPFKYGKFGYFDTVSTYPDNAELYNSNNLVIDFDTIPNDYKAEFFEYYVSNGQLNADYRCEPIRLYKAPDFAIAPYMSTSESVPFGKSLIYPLGATIDENLINYFLDIAVSSNLLTQEQRNKIVGYKIKIADRTLNKSIIAKGLAYDMFAYQEVGATNPADVWFPNFPYNDNSPNELLYTGNDRTNFINHKFNGLSNYNFTFHGAETSFGKPLLPTELKIEAYQQGTSRGNFVEVENHVRHVVLGKDAYQIATTLAIIETTFELALNLADLTINASSNFWVVAGFSTGSSAPGLALSIGALAVYIGVSIASSVLKVGQYRKQWLDTISNLGQPKNFASYYTSIADYNSSTPNTDEGNMLRAVKTKKYLKPGNYQFTEESTGQTLKINNENRESSVFISTGSDYPIQYPASYVTKDNSRIIASDSVGCENQKKSSIAERTVASPYFALKNYVANQYGEIGSVKWISTGYTGDLRNPNPYPAIFGGDTFITRFSVKRKHPIFSEMAMNFADRTPFNYTIARNVGVPRFYADFLSTTEDGGLGNSLFPDTNTEYNFDCKTGENSSYLKNPSKFYLAYYGQPYFLVESEINTTYRYASTGKQNDFWPNNEDYIDLTQENQVSIKNDNTFFYNPIYSKKTTQILNRSLPIDYNQEYYDKIAYQTNQVFASMPDTSDLDRFEPWLAYRPLDVHQFKMELGKLVDLSDIESGQILGRFENGYLRFNALDRLRERITPQNQELGLAGIFAERPLEAKRTKLGYAGTQHTEMISCEYGHFWVDAKRGQVLQVDQNGESLKDITAGVSKWFKEQLPFKILKSNPTAEIDNSYNGVGIAMGWDAKNKRVFLTKKDYIPNIPCVQYDEELGWVINETTCGTEPALTCPEGFTYNSETELCQKVNVYDICPDGFNYNETTNLCEKITTSEICPQGYTYNSETFLCEQAGDTCIGGLDLVFILDATGSQQSAINNIKNAISSLIIPSIQEKFGDNYRLGLVTVTDKRGQVVDGAIVPAPIFDILEPMSVTNQASFSNQLNTVVAQFGGTQPEPYDLALKAVVNNTVSIDNNGNPIGINTIGAFRESASKAIMLVTDTFPSGFDDSYQYSDYLTTIEAANEAAEKDIKIFSYFTGAVDVPPIEPENPVDLSRVFVLEGGAPANINLLVGAVAYALPFVTDLEETAQNFVDTHAAAILSATGATVTAIGSVIKFEDLDSGSPFSPQYTGLSSLRAINSAMPLLNGTYILKEIAEITDGTYTFNALGQNMADSIVDAIVDSIDCVNVIPPNNCNGCVTIDNSCICTTTITPNDCSGCNVNNETCTCVETTSPTLVDVLTPIEITPENFTEASWTIAYSPLTESWISYYSFLPNYYISHQDYFQTGLNGTGASLWSHLLTNRSYRVFYGEVYPWIVEMATKPTLDKKILGNVVFQVDSERFHNEYDSAYLPLIGMESMVVYNQTNNSGLVKFAEEQKNNLYQKAQYPITTANSQEVLVTKYDDYFKVNYFFNRVKNENSNVPNWIKDNVDVNKTLNYQNLGYNSPLPERMKGNWFLVRFYKTGNTNIKSIFKFNVDEGVIYP